MPRGHSRNARFMMNITSAGTAEPIAFISSFSFSSATDKVDVTAFGDLGKVYVPGLPDSSGSFEGWYDSATDQTYTAALDGVARKMYLYPDFVTNPGEYWFGTIFPDFSVEGSVDSALSISASWNAASAIVKVG